MENIRFDTFKPITMDDMTEIWNRCWKGYYFDMSYTPEHMKVWLELGQVSLQNSVAIFINGRVCGFSLLSIDGTDGWIAGACIDPRYRGNALFLPLIGSQRNLANSLGLKKIYLEVLEQNFAFKVYRSAGFKAVRKLNIYRNHIRQDLNNWSHKLPTLELITTDDYFANRCRASFHPAWQRREDYLRRYSRTQAVINSTRTAGALFAGENYVLLLDAWSETAAGAEELISILLQRSEKTFSLINQPDDLIATSLKDQGIHPSSKQFEMCLDLL